jgi:hypothetical protein
VLETLVVVVSVSLLGGLAWMVASLTPLVLLWCVATTMGLGVLLGVPGGLGYHIVLRRELIRVSALTPGWIWRPVSFHAVLDERGMGRVRPWFLAGAYGFLLIMAGGALLLVTVLTHFR